MSTHSSTRDLSFVFQPLIHEPLSNPAFLQNHVNGDAGVNGRISDGSHEQKVLLAAMKEAFESKAQHPRKAMSLFLKAGKGLVLIGDDDTALECFESLIHLAKEQLNHVCTEKSKLPPLTAEERTELCHKNSPLNQDNTKLIAEPTLLEKPSLMVNSHSEHMPSSGTENRDNALKPMDHDLVLNGSETKGQEALGVHGNATEDVDASKESKSFVAQGNTSSLYSSETPLEENSSRLFDIGSPVSFDIGSPVSGTLTSTPTLDSVASVLCGAEVMQENMLICEPVECTESLPEEVCEVATVESDDNQSFCSIGSMEHVAQTHEIVVECVTSNAEVVPLNPVKKALVSRGYVVSELLDTEQSYIQDLGHVVKGYIGEFSSCSDLPLELKDKEKEVFSNLEEIYQWHSREFYAK